jgi:hypothetical protein
MKVYRLEQTYLKHVGIQCHQWNRHFNISIIDTPYESFLKKINFHVVRIINLYVTDPMLVICFASFELFHNSITGIFVGDLGGVRVMITFVQFI